MLTPSAAWKSTARTLATPGPGSAFKPDVLPFSKRPPPPEEYFLRSGDFEAAPVGNPAHNANAPSYVPPAPRAPIFARHVAATPYGFSQGPQSQRSYAAHHEQSVGPAPHSLAPMAMNSQHAASTGTNRAMSMSQSGASIVLREKPSLKWGVMIALTGALLGGVLGLGMDARRQSARAAAAAEANDAAPPAVVAAAQPVLPVVLAPPVAPSTVATVAQPAVAQPAVAQPQIIAPPAAVVLAVAPSVVVPKGAIHTKPFVKPHGFLAAKVTSPARPAPEPKADAPEPKTAKADKVDPPKTVKKDANTSDAMKILEAANKDTTNTL